MKQNQRKNTQRQIADLIPIIELCLPLIKKLNKTQDKLKFLPTELELLQNQAKLIDLEMSLEESRNLADSDSQLISETNEFELDSIVNDLEGIFIYLTTLDDGLKNLLALKERLEAIQEERIDSLTPERVYKLLEKQQENLQNKTNLQSGSKSNRFQKVWQKIVDYRPSKKLIKVSVITTGIILSFSLIYNSVIEHQSVENNMQQKQENPEN
ncbi:hypothetical protein [Myxosarcina sp. GI1]|uniref:hypothetical protein n=1 Tax=Myxosarcina sp. GI1 TaxID=1541065 RepID=UPI0005687097|nr:hypothetical protein [Myxosarcina sp. GI1]